MKRLKLAWLVLEFFNIQMSDWLYVIHEVIRPRGGERERDRIKKRNCKNCFACTRRAANCEFHYTLPLPPSLPSFPSPSHPPSFTDSLPPNSLPPSLFLPPSLLPWLPPSFPDSLPPSLPSLSQVWLNHKLEAVPCNKLTPLFCSWWGCPKNLKNSGCIIRSSRSNFSNDKSNWFISCLNDLPTNIYGGVTINSWEPKMRLVSENIYVGRWGLTGEESLSLHLPSSNSETEKRDGPWIKLIIQISKPENRATCNLAPPTKYWPIYKS